MFADYPFHIRVVERTNFIYSKIMNKIIYIHAKANKIRFKLNLILSEAKPHWGKAGLLPKTDVVHSLFTHSIILYSM